MDLHVLFFKLPVDTFDYDVSGNKARLDGVIQHADIGELFDLVEFLIRHPGCSDELKGELADAFVMARAAYRVFDNKYIAAIGMEEQAAAFERAIAETGAKNATAARKQLIAAGVALRNSDWAGSVRESIHAVEAMAVRLAPGTDTLGAALKVLEQRGHLHGSLKAGFGSLYGYSSDEEGVRHARARRSFRICLRAGRSRVFGPYPCCVIPEPCTLHWPVTFVHQAPAGLPHPTERRAQGRQGLNDRPAKLSGRRERSNHWG